MATSYLDLDEPTAVSEWMRGLGRRTLGLLLLTVTAFPGPGLGRLRSRRPVLQPGEQCRDRQPGGGHRCRDRRPLAADVRQGGLAGAAGRSLLGRAVGGQPPARVAVAAAHRPAAGLAQRGSVPRRLARAGGRGVAVSGRARRHRRRFRAALSGAAPAGGAVWLADRQRRAAVRHRRPGPQVAREQLGDRPGRIRLTLARPSAGRCRGLDRRLFRPAARRRPAQPAQSPGRGERSEPPSSQRRPCPSAWRPTTCARAC